MYVMLNRRLFMCNQCIMIVPNITSKLISRNVDNSVSLWRRPSPLVPRMHGASTSDSRNPMDGESILSTRDRRIK